MFDIIEQARLGELHFKSDPDSGLKSIIAIHNTKLGPALGGCRCIEYHSDTAAIMDVVRLARGMSYKAALAKVPQGGGKAVILKPAEPFIKPSAVSSMNWAGAISPPSTAVPPFTIWIRWQKSLPTYPAATVTGWTHHPTLPWVYWQA